ncbi:hypothetical protein M5D96_004743, partial [Drosophila gunungcola]
LVVTLPRLLLVAKIQILVVGIDRQPSAIGSGESSVGITAPLHGCAFRISRDPLVVIDARFAGRLVHGIAPANVPVIRHTQLFALKCNGNSGQCHQQHIHGVHCLLTESRCHSRIVVVPHHPVGHMTMRHIDEPPGDVEHKVRSCRVGIQLGDKVKVEGKLWSLNSIRVFVVLH